MDEHKPAPSSTENGLDPKVSALLCYLITFVGGIVFYIISKDKFVRFHAMQSIFLGVAMFVVQLVMTYLVFFLPVIFILPTLVWFGFVALSIVMMVKSYNGEHYKLPIIGDLAEKYSK